LTALVDTSVLLGSRPVEDLGEPWVLSVISVGELEAGILLAKNDALRAARLARLAAVLVEAPTVSVDRSVAARYGELRSATGRAPANDLWIAATALAHDFTLMTVDGRQAALPLVRARLVS
jgi:predicted nucleic acid-binding protein